MTFFKTGHAYKEPRYRNVGNPNNYMEYVGPPQHFDYIAGLVFSLLFSYGLKAHHRLLDIGCGSLRIGRLLIPYLLPQNYVGIEPNEKILKMGIENEVGSLIDIKQATIIIADNAKSLDQKFDFILAFSIFTHCGLDLLNYWISEGSRLLKDTGKYFATFFDGLKPVAINNEKHYPYRNGWVYPDVLEYNKNIIEDVVKKHKLMCEFIGWEHLGQKLVLLKKNV